MLGQKSTTFFLLACLLFTSCFAQHSNIVTKERGNRLMLFNIKMLNLCFCNLLHFLSVRDLRCFLLSAKQTCSDLPVFFSLLSVLFLPIFLHLYNKHICLKNEHSSRFIQIVTMLIKVQILFLYMKTQTQTRVWLQQQRNNS